MIDPILERARAAMTTNAARWFQYHPPVADQAQRYDRVRAAALACSREIIAAGIPSFELNNALEALRRAVFWANASIADETPKE